MALNTLYACVESYTGDYKEGYILVVIRSSGEVRILTQKYAKAHSLCAVPATLEAHTSSLRRNGICFTKHAATQMLRVLIAQGLLVQVPAQHPSLMSRKSAPLTHAVVFTAGRVEKCLRCVQSLCTSLEDSSLTNVTVIDGSFSRGNEDNLKAGLSRIAKKTNLSVSYVGSRECSAFCGFLVRMGVPAHLLNPLLTGTSEIFSAGAMRNLALLLFQGCSYLSLDDDVLWEITSANNLSNDVCLHGHQRPRFISVGSSRTGDPPNPLVRQASHVAFEALEQLLGASLENLARNHRLQIEDACDHQRASLISKQGIVPLVQLGVVGDSGMYTGDWLSLLGPDVQNCISRSDQFCELSLTCRELINVSTRTVVTHDPRCMMLATGVCNSFPLPPFPPLYRNEDGVFAGLTSAASQRAYFGHVPHAILHDAPYGRVYGDGIALRVSDLLFQATIEASRCFLHDELTNYKLMGTHLVESCRNDPNDAIRRWSMQTHLQRIGFISSMKAASSSSTRWKQHISALEQRLDSSVMLGFDQLPADLRITACEAEKSQREGRSALLAFIRNFGECLISWSELRQIAAECMNSAPCRAEILTVCS
jgi:hypothetical protein